MSFDYFGLGKLPSETVVTFQGIPVRYETLDTMRDYGPKLGAITDEHGNPVDHLCHCALCHQRTLALRRILPLYRAARRERQEQGWDLTDWPDL